MGQTFKVFDPATGQYVEKEIESMTPVQETAQAVQQAAAPVVQAVQQAPEAVPLAPFCRLKNVSINAVLDEMGIA